jgi:putative flippase GtrA
MANRKLHIEVARFGLVGVLATLVHAGILVFVVELLGWDPVASTPFAFCVAVLVSYLGNFFWTFDSEYGLISRLPKFVLVQLSGMALATLIMFLVVDVLNWIYPVGLALSLALVPVFTFVVHRRWTFGAEKSVRGA